MQTDHRELLSVAQQAFQNKDYDEAEAILAKLIESRADYADVYSLLGKVNYEQGRFAKAVQALEKAVSINPNYLEALMYLSVLYHDLGYYDKGKKHEKKLYSLPKLSGSKRIASPFRAKLANMHAEIGDLYRDLGCYAEARLEYDQALLLEAQYPDIRVKRALCLQYLDGREAAIRELKDIVKAHPKYVRGHLELGTLYYTDDRRELARGAWQALLKLKPGHPTATIYLKLLNARPSGPIKVEAVAKSKGNKSESKSIKPAKAVASKKPVKVAKSAKPAAKAKRR